MIAIVEEIKSSIANCLDCSDQDEDCDEIEDKSHCWLYAPERGMCPFLRATLSPDRPAEGTKP